MEETGFEKPIRHLGLNKVMWDVKYVDLDGMDLRDSVESPRFELQGTPGFFFELYPYGFNDQHPKLFLHGPRGTDVKFRLELDGEEAETHDYCHLKWDDAVCENAWVELPEPRKVFDKAVVEVRSLRNAPAPAASGFSAGARRSPGHSKVARPATATRRGGWQETGFERPIVYLGDNKVMWDVKYVDLEGLDLRDSVESPRFELKGTPGFFFELYPRGFNDEHPKLFLHGPKGADVKFRLEFDGEEAETHDYCHLMWDDDVCENAWVELSEPRKQFDKAVVEVRGLRLLNR